jgi:hypothetical protein
VGDFDRGGWDARQSIMIPASKNPDLVFGDLIDKAVFSIYSTRPATFEFVLERFWFANSFERIT